MCVCACVCVCVGVFVFVFVCVCVSQATVVQPALFVAGFCSTAWRCRCAVNAGLLAEVLGVPACRG